MFEPVAMYHSISTLPFLTASTAGSRIFASDVQTDVGMSGPKFTPLQKALNACFTEML